MRLDPEIYIGTGKPRYWKASRVAIPALPPCGSHVAIMLQYSLSQGEISQQNEFFDIIRNQIAPDVEESVNLMAFPIDRVNLVFYGTAVDRLQYALAYYQEHAHDPKLHDALIGRFKNTYSQAEKVLRQFLQFEPGPTQYSDLSFAELIEAANRQHVFIADLNNWDPYHTMYRKIKENDDCFAASKIVTALPLFLEEALYLLNIMSSTQR